MFLYFQRLLEHHYLVVIWPENRLSLVHPHQHGGAPQHVFGQIPQHRPGYGGSAVLHGRKRGAKTEFLAAVKNIHRARRHGVQPRILELIGKAGALLFVAVEFRVGGLFGRVIAAPDGKRAFQQRIDAGSAQIY